VASNRGLLRVFCNFSAPSAVLINEFHAEYEVPGLETEWRVLLEMIHAHIAEQRGPIRKRALLSIAGLLIGVAMLLPASALAAASSAFGSPLAPTNRIGSGETEFTYCEKRRCGADPRSLRAPFSSRR
jgi:hypothetical protein